MAPFFRKINYLGEKHGQVPAAILFHQNKPDKRASSVAFQRAKHVEGLQWCHFSGNITHYNARQLPLMLGNHHTCRPSAGVRGPCFRIKHSSVSTVRVNSIPPWFAVTNSVVGVTMKAINLIIKLLNNNLITYLTKETKIHSAKQSKARRGKMSPK